MFRSPTHPPITITIRRHLGQPTTRFPCTQLQTSSLNYFNEPPTTRPIPARHFSTQSNTRPIEEGMDSVPTYPRLVLSQGSNAQDSFRAPIETSAQQPCMESVQCSCKPASLVKCNVCLRRTSREIFERTGEGVASRRAREEGTVEEGGEERRGREGGGRTKGVHGPTAAQIVASCAGQGKSLLLGP